MSTHVTGQPAGYVGSPLVGPDPDGAPCSVHMGTAPARWILAASILATGMAFLDGTVVNVALRAIGDDLDADLADLQWVVNAYLLVLAALILLAGSLGDLLGRRRVFLIGVVWFAVASVGCGLAQDPTMLIVARGAAGGRRCAADAGQPVDHPVGVPPGRPRGGDRRVVGHGRRHDGARPGAGRLAGAVGVVAVHVLDQRAARRRRRRDRAAARAGEPRHRPVRVRTSTSSVPSSARSGSAGSRTR